MQKLDREIEEVNKWMDGAEKKMDEIDDQGPNDAVLKVFSFTPSSPLICPYFLMVFYAC